MGRSAGAEPLGRHAGTRGCGLRPSPRMVHSTQQGTNQKDGPGWRSQRQPEALIPNLRDRLRTREKSIHRRLRRFCGHEGAPLKPSGASSAAAGAPSRGSVASSHVGPLDAVPAVHPPRVDLGHQASWPYRPDPPNRANRPWQRRPSADLPPSHRCWSGCPVRGLSRQARLLRVLPAVRVADRRATRQTTARLPATYG